MSDHAVLQFEMFASGVASGEALWALVGDPRRCVEWTDAQDVVAPEPPFEVGSRFTTRDGERWLEWVVITAGPRLLEVKTDGCAAGRVGVGVHVTADPAGARLVVAGMLDPRAGRLRARAVDLPALRRRCERWVDTALAAAARA